MAKTPSMPLSVVTTADSLNSTGKRQRRARFLVPVGIGCQYKSAVHDLYMLGPTQLLCQPLGLLEGMGTHEQLCLSPQVRDRSFMRGDARASKDALQGLAYDAVPAHSVPSPATQTSLESAVAPTWLPRQSSPPPRE